MGFSLKKTIKVKKDESSEDYFFDLGDFSDFVDINQVKSYSLKEENGGLVLYFFDQNDNLIVLKEREINDSN